MTRTVTGPAEILALAGADLGHTAWLEITQDRVDTFADATSDHQWIHVDVERAKEGPFRGTIAHGYLTLSLLVPLFSELLEIRGMSMSVNYGFNTVRFPAPVPVGGKIRLAGKVGGPGVRPLGQETTR
jgi:acyl dehydratase